MGGSDLGCCANLIRAILIIINLLFGALGIVVFALGIWAIVEDQDFSFITGSSIASGAAILIVAGIITMIICVIGIIGAIFKARPILVIYAVAVAIIVILEIVAGIVVFVFRDELTDRIEDNFLEAMEMYRASEDEEGFQEDVNDALNVVQSTLNCCGFNSPRDWFIINPQAVAGSTGDGPGCDPCTPGIDTDCATFINNTLTLSFNATERGCANVTNDRLTVFIYVVGGVGIAFGIAEIVGILFALFLCCCITSARKQEVV